MPFSFPASPAVAVGATSTQNGRSYTYAGNNVWELTPATGGGEDARWDYFKPAAPTSVTASAGNTQATVSWTAPASPVVPITDYVVQYSSNSGTTWTTWTPPTPTITISSQPSNQTASSGSATFSVTASLNVSGTLGYQWQKSDNAGSTWANVSGATSSSLALSSLTNEADHSDQYRVVVSSTGATSVTSSAATLTVSAIAGVTVQSGSASGSGTNTITATATGNISVSVPTARTVTWTGSPGQYIAGPQQAGFDYDSEYGFWYRNFLGSSFTVIAGTYTTENTGNGATFTFTPVS